jgi:DNA polymerase III subunit gamma/tau
MRKQAAEFGQDRLAKAAETISNGLIEMRGATSPRLLLELMCAQVLLPAEAAHAPAHSESPEATASNELAARVERLERQLASGAMTDRQRVPSPGRRPGTGSPADQNPAERGQAARSEAQAARSEAPATRGEAPATLDLDMLQSRWADVLAAVRDVRKTAWILLNSYASIDAIEGNVLTIAFDTEGNAKGFANSGSDGYLADVLHAMFGARLVIRAIVNPAGGRGAVRGPTRPAGDDPGGRHDDGRGAGPAAGSAPAGVSRRSSDEPGISRTRERADPLADARDAGSRRGPGNSRGQAAEADGQPQAGPKTQTTAPRGETRRRQSAASRRRQTTGNDLADDPRPHTDADAGSETDGLTGTDLVMRELGGRVIEEITDV